MEALTDELEAAAQELFDQVEDRGGAVAAIEEGFMQRRIEDSAYREARAQAGGESVVVGVNRFQVDEDGAIEVLRVDPELERSQCERLAHHRRRRHPIDHHLAAITEAASGSANLLPVMKGALAIGATVGEVSDALRDVFGTHRA